MYAGNLLSIKDRHAASIATSHATCAVGDMCLNKKMKQLDVDVSPPAFLWDPHLNLTNVTFDLDPCAYNMGLYHRSSVMVKKVGHGPVILV